MRRISFGAVNGRRFCFSAGLGFDAEAVRRMDQLGRDPGGARPGDLAFGLLVARILVERRARFEPALEIAGIGRAAFVLVANGDPYSYAGRMPLRIAPDARFEDGIAFAAPVRVRRARRPAALHRRGSRDELRARRLHGRRPRPARGASATARCRCTSTARTSATSTGRCSRRSRDALDCLV